MHFLVQFHKKLPLEEEEEEKKKEEEEEGGAFTGNGPSPANNKKVVLRQGTP